MTSIFTPRAAAAKRASRCAADHLCRERASGLQRGEIVRAAERCPSEFLPVFGKDFLQLSDDRAADFILRVAPVFVVLRVAGPVVCPACAAAKSGMAIDDEDAPVSAMIVSQWNEKIERAVFANIDSGSTHRRDMMVAPRPAAEGVEDDVDLHSGARSLREDATKVRDRLAISRSVAFKRDALFRRRCGPEHGRKKRVAVYERACRVSAGPRSQRDHGEFIGKRRGVHRRRLGGNVPHRSACAGRKGQCREQESGWTQNARHFAFFSFTSRVRPSGDILTVHLVPVAPTIFAS
jgi:hypothetical protein